MFLLWVSTIVWLELNLNNLWAYCHQAMCWFTDNELETGLPVFRVKNAFAFQLEVANGCKGPVDGAGASGPSPGYRDIKVFASVKVQGSGGAQIIGEIQVHDVELHALKQKVCAHPSPAPSLSRSASRI